MPAARTFSFRAVRSADSRVVIYPGAGGKPSASHCSQHGAYGQHAPGGGLRSCDWTSSDKFESRKIDSSPIEGGGTRPSPP
jgi:hypothetical protein